ncbi:uncharacterized protein LOC120112114 [Phoenix dactylifera]|uniref:Uncharacterized protein LOC120112114 n=1 Tax=Phoenix dactylifera TaxID=42345 RepID=A0A8B9AKC9_PHODC|nr:uncharacterized protein LOC120112114 [Phoenix dactylifera]
MAPEDEEKTAFITDGGTYCYKVMPFGLKNAGATYQRLVSQIFKDQIGRSMEVYVDDMLVKSKVAQDHVTDLSKAFSILRRYQMKLNPAKCAFEVTSGKFLGFVISQRGIEANPEKIRALQEMTPPRTVKEVQRLTGRVAALGRFVSRSAERCLPFFAALKKPKDFLWSAQSVSSVLVREESKLQKPVYYTSRVLRGAETRYSKLEKTAYALVVSARRLRPYFQAHTVAVLTDQPVKQILQRSDRAGRITKWAIELGEFDIEYRPRPAIKAQALADFIVECTVPDEPEARPASDEQTSTEYEALVAELKLAKELGVKDLRAFSDSQLVVNQILGDFEAREPTMQEYFRKVRDLTSALDSFHIQHIARTENSRADQLSKLASSCMSELPKAAALEYLQRPSMEEPEPTLCIEVVPSWMDELVNYLRDGVLPSDEREARRVKRLAARYILYEGKLYRRSFTSPLLRCLRPSEADYAMREVHEGICGSHMGGRALAHKILRQRYYWPTLQKDTLDFIQRCDRCQRNANIQRRPSALLTSISSPWPFAQWGIDILGPFPLATGQKKFIVVAIDYFTKWRLKARLDRSKGQWVEDLYNVLWAYRTTFRVPTGETPFNLTYGTEAVIPLEIGLPSSRVEHFDASSSSSQLRNNLDLVEEVREAARVRMAKYQQRTAQYYNARVKIKSFKEGDLVLRKAEASQPTEQGKMAPNWKGPYQIARVQRPGAYKLKSLGGTLIPWSWSSENLRVYYQ